MPRLISQALDTDKSGDVDLAELRTSYHTWFGAALKPVRALIVIDVQNDFIDGTLRLKDCPAGQDGACVVPVCSRFLRALFSTHPLMCFQLLSLLSFAGDQQNAHGSQFRLCCHLARLASASPLLLSRELHRRRLPRSPSPISVQGGRIERS